MGTVLIRDFGIRGFQLSNPEGLKGPYHCHAVHRVLIIEAGETKIASFFYQGLFEYPQYYGS